MYGDAITSLDCLAETVRRFGSIVIGAEKFGSNQECRSLRSARIVASWTDEQGLISPHAGLRPGKVHSFAQHTLKIGSHSQQHVFALVDWYVEDENKHKYGKLFEENISSWRPITVSSSGQNFFQNSLSHQHLKTKLS